MRTGRPTPPLVLTMNERATLQQWARRPKTAQALAQRARMILACAEGQTNKAVARAIRVAQQTVCKWRQRFVAQRLDGLLDEPRPGAPRTVTDATIDRLVAQTLETTPANAGCTRVSGRSKSPSVSTSPLRTSSRPRFQWTKTADEILASVARFCQRTSETGH